MIVPIPWVLFGMGFLTAVVSVPLILHKIPMNRAYGIRVRKAFASERNWYALNAYGGRLLLTFGLGLMVFGVATRDLAPPPTSPWALVYMVAPLLAILPILARIRAFANRLPEK